MPELQHAISLLHQGHLVAFPTETVYGLGAAATNPAAIDLIYQTKGRPSTNPLILHVASEEIARRYVADWPLAASRLAQAFWPGPLTLILPKHLKFTQDSGLPDPRQRHRRSPHSRTARAQSSPGARIAP